MSEFKKKKKEKCTLLCSPRSDNPFHRNICYGNFLQFLESCLEGSVVPCNRSGEKNTDFMVGLQFKFPFANANIMYHKEKN